MPLGCRDPTEGVGNPWQAPAGRQWTATRGRCGEAGPQELVRRSGAQCVFLLDAPGPCSYAAARAPAPQLGERGRAHRARRGHAAVRGPSPPTEAAAVVCLPRATAPTLSYHIAWRTLCPAVRR